MKRRPDSSSAFPTPQREREASYKKKRKITFNKLQWGARSFSPINNKDKIQRETAGVGEQTLESDHGGFQPHWRGAWFKLQNTQKGETREQRRSSVVFVAHLKMPPDL